MVGFKSIGLLFILLFLASCIPQTKQTECSTNEAFNAILRTCVPVMNGPSSFIDIDSFQPASVLSKYKNDTSAVQFSIVVANPYAQTYTVTWERVYNGSPVVLAGTSSGTTFTYTTTPSSLSTQLGTHVITARVLDSTNAVVDSHSFELKINETPRPVIVSSSVTPALYSAQYTPQNSNQNYSFQVYNNNATMSGAGYRTDWKLYKSGVQIYSETDNFPTTSPIGTISPSGYNYPSMTFSPSTLGVGGYVINARVTNNAGEVVAEQQWSATVAHPPLPKITNRDIYASPTSPYATVHSTDIVAYNNIPYTGSTSYNFIPETVTTPAPGAQGNFCVTVANGTGTYSSDTYFVKVSYYLDGSTHIYDGLTTAVDPQVCLSDAQVATLNTVLFSNMTSTTEQDHTLVARVVDEATGQEYSAGDMNNQVALGNYPITWDVKVRPQNEAPKVSFGTMTALTCSSSSSTTKSGCSIGSDTNFKVKINLTSDDFYTLPGNETKFDYSIRLYQNGVNIQTCTKSGYSVSDPYLTAAADTNGADGYECEFRINSYNAAGPINNATFSYQIQAEISDVDSPITSSGSTSNTLVWNFPVGSVTETNTAPTISNWSPSGAVTEGQSMTFSVDVSDDQRDNFSYIIKYCTNVGCTSSATLTQGSVTRTSSTDPYNLSVSYTLPEDFLLGLTGLGCDAVKRGNTCSVPYFISVTDTPFTATPGTVVSAQTASSITNFNPAPTLNLAAASPVPTNLAATTLFGFVGHPFSIYNPPATLTDTSGVATEKNFRYQWFIKNNTSVTAWTQIEGANTNNLIWTPSFIKEANLATDNPLTIMLCVEDHPVSAVTNVNISDSICSATTQFWTITVRNNMAVAHDMSSPISQDSLAYSSSDKGTETAIWYDTPSTFNAVSSSAAYIAMTGNAQSGTQYIYVKKVLVKDRGGIDIIDSELLVRFYPVPTGTVHTVKDLSIVGNDKELYIAYLASRTGSPNSFYPQVRRIDLKDTNGKQAPNNHEGKFGFDYDGLGFVNGCTPTADCDATSASGVTTISFSPSAGSIIGSIVIQTPNGDPIGNPNENVTIDFGTYDGVDTICSTCSGQTMATNLETIINTSTDPKLAGYSATRVGSTVTISGAEAGDYFDASTDPNSRIADRLGKIYIHGSTWYLPFIDSSLGGSYNDRISVYYSSTGSIMSLVAESILDANDGTTGLSSFCFSF